MGKITLFDVLKDVILMVIVFFLQLWFNNCVYETDFISVMFGMSILVIGYTINYIMNYLLEYIKLKRELKKNIEELDKMLQEWEDKYKHESK